MVNYCPSILVYEQIVDEAGLITSWAAVIVPGWMQIRPATPLTRSAYSARGLTRVSIFNICVRTGGLRSSLMKTPWPQCARVRQRGIAGRP